jgi:hypothetical protein
MRHLAHDWLRARRRLTVVGDLDVQATDEAAGSGRVNPGIGSAAEAQAEARDEARMVTRAFGRLPARWRAVLWQLEVEGKAPAAVAPMFGLSANGVSALAMRAREGLRQAYLEEHVGANIPAGCRTYAAEFGAGARGRLSQRRRAAMQEHLGHCPACQDLFTELTELNSRLGTILTPAALAAASSALGSAKRATVLRASLTGHWRTWRWHPVTSATGAAASVAVVGGMLLAVNVTPVTSPPAHAATGPAAPAATPLGSFDRKRQPGGGGAGGGAASAAAHSGPHSLSGPGSLLAAVTRPSGAIPGAPPGGSAPAAPVNPRQASQAPSSGGTTVTSAPANPNQTITNATGATVTGLTNAVGGLTSTAGTTVGGLVNTAGATVTGLTNAAGTTVTGLTNTATATVTGLVTGLVNTAGTTVAGVTNAASGLVSTATNTVTSATSTATGAVTGIASTAGATVAAAGETVSIVASTATSTVTGAASTAANVVTGVVGTASTIPAVAGTAAKTVAGGASTAGRTVPNTASTAATAATASTVAAVATGLAGAAANL